MLGDHSTTGDGLMAALQTLAALAATGRRASDATRLFDALPQLLRNVRVTGGDPLRSARAQAAIAAAEARLGARGRLVIRPSGTEPVIRLMAEGDDEALVSAVIDDVAAAVIEAAEQAGERTGAAAQ